jgi:hypothetical protein
LLPPLRNGEIAQLHDPKIEDKETRPPQQGGRSEARHPLSLEWMVCPSGVDLSAFEERGWL